MAAVVLIVGVPGAGKTTVARALAARFPRSACIEGDLVQDHFTVNGLVGPGESPAEESDRQMALRWRNCAALADGFAAEGFTAIVEHATSDRRWVDLFAATLRTRPLSLVVLAPHQRAALARDAGRGNKQVAHHFTHMDTQMRADLADLGWWLDTTDLTVDQTVQAVYSEGLQAGRWPFGASPGGAH